MTAKRKPAAKREAPVTTKREIRRTGTGGAWWCPFCDHSQDSLTTSCRGCGAERDGDVAVALAGAVPPEDEG